MTRLEGSLSEPLDEPGRVIGYVRLLIFICVASAAVAVAAVLWRAESQLNRLEKGTTYHLGSIDRSNEVFQTAADLRGLVFDALASPMRASADTETTPSGDSYTVLMNQVGAAIADLEKLQRQYGEPEMKGTVRRLGEHLATLEATSAGRRHLSDFARPELQNFRDKIDPLIIAARQLVRLHEIAYREDHVAMGDAERVDQIALIVLILGAGAAGALFVRRLLRQIRGLLETGEHARRELVRATTGFANARRVAQLGYWEMVLATGALRWSDEMFDIVGLNAAQGPPDNDGFHALIHPEDRAAVAAWEKRLPRDGTPGRIEYRITRPDGTERFIQEIASVLPETADSPTRITGIMRDITEPKLAAESLQESQTQFEHAERIASLYHWVTDEPEQNWNYASKNAVQMLGLASPDDLPASVAVYYALLHPEDRARIEQQDQDLARRPAPYERIYRIRRGDGEIRHFKEAAEPLYDSAGRLTGYRGTTQDITDLMVSEAALRESQAQFEHAERIADLCHWVTDLWNSEWTYASAHAAEMFGVDSAESLLGPMAKFFTLVHPEDREFLTRKYQRIAGRPESFTHGYRIIRSDGAVRYFKEVGEPLYDDDGRHVGFRGTTQDVTDQKETEAALREIQVRFEHAERMADLCHWLTDADDLNWVATSKNTARMFGVDSTESLLGPTADFYRFVHPDDLAAVKERDERVAGNPQRYEDVYRIMRPDGAVRYFKEIGEPYYDATGRHLGYRGTTIDITEQKETEIALRNSQIQFEQAERIANLWHWMTDETDTNWIFASKNAAAMYGVGSPEELLGSDDAFYSFIHPDERDALLARNRALAKSPRPYENQYRIIRPDGTVRHFHEVGEPAYDESGRLVGFRGTTQDVTDRREAEIALRENQRKLAEAQRIARIGSWDQDYASNTLTWSDQIFRIFETDPSESAPAYDAFLDLIHPDDRERFLTTYENSLKNREPYETVYRLLMPDGRIKWVHERCETEFDRHGKPLVSRGTVQDVTALKRAEEALRRSELNYRALFENAAAGIGRTRLSDGKMLMANRKLASMLGYDSVEACVADFVASERYVDPSQRMAILAEYAKHPEQTFEIALTRKDGTIITTEGHGVANAEHDQLDFVLVDITERKRAEEEVRRLNETLERRVDERTEALRAAQEELLRAERLATLGRLTATVSHELRNPLAAAKTSATVLKQRLDGADDKVEAALGRIERGITRCDRIVDELLDFTRVSVIDLTPTALDSWLAEVIADQSLPEGVTLLEDFGAGEAVVPIDPDRLRRAVINVLDNACQAMTQNGEGRSDRAEDRGILTVRTRRRDGRIEIDVEDSGPGIPSDVRTRIFEPLFSTKSFGVGLGLPIVKQVMEQHGGGVDIEAAPGGGALVRLWLASEAESTAAA